jgi:hypothetical protein
MCGSGKNSSRSRTDSLLSVMSLSLGRGTDNPERAAAGLRMTVTAVVLAVTRDPASAPSAESGAALRAAVNGCEQFNPFRAP